MFFLIYWSLDSIGTLFLKFLKPFRPKFNKNLKIRKLLLGWAEDFLASLVYNNFIISYIIFNFYEVKHYHFFSIMTYRADVWKYGAQ